LEKDEQDSDRTLRALLRELLWKIPSLVVTFGLLFLVVVYNHEIGRAVAAAINSFQERNDGVGSRGKSSTDIGAQPPIGSPTSALPQSPSIKIEYDQTPYCPPAGCFENHVLKILNTGLQPLHIQSVLLNNRSNTPACLLAVNKTLQTGDHWSETTSGIFGPNVEEKCGAVVMLTVNTDSGGFDYRMDQ
jgi:hypothetical protein